MPTLADRFRGCLLGALIGDVIGAVVEAESPQYIAGRYRSINDILGEDSIEEFTGPRWRVGNYTDDTQMTICVAEWLIAGEAPSGEHLLARFASAQEPWRRYGSGTRAILQTFEQHRKQWRELSTMMFPHGSWGNGSAMRVAPVGLFCHRHRDRVRELAIESSRPTHSHPLAYQGATLQALAVAIAATLDEFSAHAFLRPLRSALVHFDDLMQDTSRFATALDAIEKGLASSASCFEMSKQLGTGIDTFEAVPMALYCFLRYSNSLTDAMHHAIFIGGDTDTIGSMTGALAGAFLGREAIPARWLARVREGKYDAQGVNELAIKLYEKCAD